MLHVLRKADLKDLTRMNSDSFHWGGGVRQSDEDGETVHLRNLGPQRSYGTCSLGDGSNYSSSSLFYNRSSPFGRVSRECLTHTVSSNETLAGIALKYDISIEDIRRANSLWTNDNVWLGQRLKIPVSTHSPTTTAGGVSIDTISTSTSSSELKVSASISGEKPETSSTTKDESKKSSKSHRSSRNQLVC